MDGSASTSLPSVTSFFAALKAGLRMVIEMLALRREHHQIRRRVVVNIAVDVMNNLAIRQRTAELILHPHSVQGGVASPLAAMLYQIRIWAIAINAKLDVTPVTQSTVDLFGGRSFDRSGIGYPAPVRPFSNGFNKHARLSRHVGQWMPGINQAANFLPLSVLDYLSPGIGGQSLTLPPSANSGYATTLFGGDFAIRKTASPKV